MACSPYVREEIQIGLRWESQEERVQQEDLHVGGKIRVNLILEGLD
jgi:hypothetical protein